MGVKIVVDSSADVASHVLDQLVVIPLNICFGEDEYVDGITINHKEFYEKLIEGDVIPTTSQATPGMFADVFEDLVNAGHEVVVITIASKLSGTYQSAVIAARDFPGKVFVVDSQTVTIGSGILAELAVSLVREGRSAAEIAEQLEIERKRIRIIAMLDTIEYLKKGGRISKTVAFAGGVLSIKPVLCLKDGEIKILGKARGSKQGNNLLVQQIEAAGGVDFSKPVLLGYTGLTDVLLTKYIQDSAFMWENAVSQLNIAAIGSVVGTHVGPGAIAAAFFTKNSTDA